MAKYHLGGQIKDIIFGNLEERGTSDCGEKDMVEAAFDFAVALDLIIATP